MTAAEATVPTIELQSIFKRYGSNEVLHDISLRVEPGECIALVGENGAGKSTLVKMLCGETEPSAGSILMNGRPVRLPDPNAARSAGIAVIPQELADCPNQTIAENLTLGRWPSVFGFTSLRAMVAEAIGLLSRFDIQIDCSLMLSDLTLAQRQLIAITRALSTNASLLLLDEPTASLNSRETDMLLTTLSTIKDSGTAVIYISHRLDECFRISDRVVVLRNGEVVAQQPTTSATTASVVNAMLGRSYRSAVRTTAAAPPNASAFFEAIGWSSHIIPRLNGISFKVRPGEILGIFGLIGSGMEAIAEGFGSKPRSRISGSIAVNGVRKHMFRDPFAANHLGIYYVPADRKGSGLALCRPIQEQITALRCRRLSTLGIVRSRAEYRLAQKLIDGFDVRCMGPFQRISELSGGNQQKVLVAGRLAAEPRMLVLHEPTQGVDIGARSQIHQIIIDAAADGMAIIVATSDLSEAISLADRLLVIRDGEVVSELVGDALTEDKALTAASERQVP